MTLPRNFADLVAQQVRRRRGDLLVAAIAGAATAGATTLLLGLSGWFLAGAAIAGAAGPLAVQAFNYLLPSAGLRALAIVRTGGRYSERLFSHRAAFQALAKLRPALFAGLAAAPRQSLSLSSGEASSRLVQDVGAIESEFVRRSIPWSIAVGAGAAAAVIALASTWAAGAYLAGLAAQVAAGRLLSHRLARAAGPERLRAAGRLKEGVGAYLQGAAELHAFGLKDRAVEALMIREAALAQAGVERSDAEAHAVLAQTVLAALNLAVAAALLRHAPMPLAALGVLCALGGQDALNGWLRAQQQTHTYRAALGRLNEVTAEPLVAATPPPASARLVVLDRHLAAGDRLGISGPSGSGKTSLLEVLVGLRDARPGSVMVDQADLGSKPTGWARSLFAFSPQDARLLTGTVEDNLRLAAPAATGTEMWQALADAQLDARVRRLPHGLQTWIGDGGESLSGGERRRLSIARALLRDAPWLVLDEPTEGLDTATESRLLAALDLRLKATGQGLIVVSHRPAPLALCNGQIDMGRPMTTLT